MKFTEHKIIHLKMDNSVAFSTLTTLCNQHLCLVSKHFHHFGVKPHTRYTPPPRPIGPQSQVFTQVCQTQSVLHCVCEYPLQRGPVKGTVSALSSSLLSSVRGRPNRAIRSDPVSKLPRTLPTRQGVRLESDCLARLRHRPGI